MCWPSASTGTMSLATNTPPARPALILSTPEVSRTRNAWRRVHWAGGRLQKGRCRFQWEAVPRGRHRPGYGGYPTLVCSRYPAVSRLSLPEKWPLENTAARRAKSGAWASLPQICRSATRRVDLRLPRSTGDAIQVCPRLRFHGLSGGEKGIRTLETVTRLHTFQACAFDHSAISPR